MDPRGQGTSLDPSPDEQLRHELGRRSGDRRSPLTIALAALVLIAIGVVGGVAIGRSTADAPQQQALPGVGDGGGLPDGATGFPGGGGSLGGGGIAFGTIESIDGNTITVQTADGGTVTVRLSGDTNIQVTEEGAIDDLETGDSVVVVGERNDNAIDATSVNEGGGVGFPQGAGSG